MREEEPVEGREGNDEDIDGSSLGLSSFVGLNDSDLDDGDEREFADDMTVAELSSITPWCGRGPFGPVGATWRIASRRRSLSR